MNVGIRITKPAYCGDPDGCVFNDRVSIEFSPVELSMLRIHFTEQALEAKEYRTQTEMRGMREAFSDAYKVWEEGRTLRDK